MAHAGAHKNQLSWRLLPQADLKMIDRAAHLRGRSRNDFVHDAALRAAENILMEHVVIRMSPGDLDGFMAAVSGPPAIVSQIVELTQRRAPWECAS